MTNLPKMCWHDQKSHALLSSDGFCAGGCRAHQQHECQESEASQMCTDLFHLGRTDFIVDPGVRVAYEPQIAAQAHAPEVGRTAVAYQPSVTDTALLP